MPRKAISLDDKKILEQRLKKKSIIIPNGCWLWEGSKSGSNGYGEIRIGSWKVHVHRLSAYLFLDFDIFSESQVNHKRECLNKNCWNPEHLYTGTQTENMIDKFALGYRNSNSYKTHCKYGHEFNDSNTGRDIDGNRVCRECARSNMQYLRDINK